MKKIIYMLAKEFCRAGLAAVLAYLGLTTSGCIAVGTSTACLIHNATQEEKR